MFKTICLSGGGAQGVFQLGALHFFQENGSLDNIQYYVGTSIGSVISLLLLCGYTSLEIYAELCKLKIFDKLSQFNVIELLSISKEYGILPITSLSEHVGALVKKKFDKIPTLQELHELTNKEIIICSVNITKKYPVYLSHLTYPNLSCIKAIEMSCSLPIVFRKCIHDNDIFIDGGFSDHFPMSQVTSVMRPVLGICTSNTQPNAILRHPLLEYIFNCMIFPIKEIERLREEQMNTKDAWIIHSEHDMPTISLDLSEQQIHKIFISGYENAHKTQPPVTLQYEPDSDEQDDGWSKWE